jgi:hypothetical protein
MTGEKRFCRHEQRACDEAEFEVHPVFGLIHKVDPPHTPFGSRVDIDENAKTTLSPKAEGR